MGNEGQDDGFLTLSEVLGLKLKADLVVLSACQTGRGKVMEGEGVANFARAFQHAGAKSVLVSLWPVASEEAVEFMTKFYGYLEEGKPRAEALSGPPGHQSQVPPTFLLGRLYPPWRGVRQVTAIFPQLHAKYLKLLRYSVDSCIIPLVWGSWP